MLGTTIDGRYRILARLARGGMATVYKARDERLDRDVAVKIMHPHLADQDEFVDRFHREARAAARLSSPHVVSVHDEGVFTGGPYSDSAAYLVMEYIAGPDLRTELTRRGSFPLKMALTIMADVLQALGTAHDAGLVHRDVKPENVMLAGESLSAKVTDFGLARALEAGNHTATGMVLGTVAYLAPEVIEAQADARSDIYAAGIMLYELIAGEVPFTADTPIALAYKHMNSTMPRLSSLASWIPSSVDSLIGHLTAKDPDQRPANGMEAYAKLMAVLNDLDEIVASRRVPVIPTIKPKKQSGITEREAEAPRRHTPSETKEFAPSTATKRYEKTARRHSPVAQRTKPRRRIWAWLVVLLLLAATAAGVYWYFTAGPGMRIALPNVVGQQKDVATDMIKDAGLRASYTEEHSDTVPEGGVISTNPSVPSDLPKDALVELTISLGVEQVAVPSVEGMTLEEAQAALSQARLEASTSEAYHDTIPAGTVISQEIAPETMVDHSSALPLVVSAGREPVQAPSVTGQPADEARHALENSGLQVSILEAYSDEVPEGEVISQDPTEGLYRGDTVTLTVSLGPELFEVPDVFGMQAGEARSILEDAGFEVTEERILGGIFNTVHSQSVPAGDLARRGTVITLTIV